MSNPVEPIRDERGLRSRLRNVMLDLQNRDILLRRRQTGSLPNLKFSFGMAHNGLEDGGRAREVTVRELPVAKLWPCQHELGFRSGARTSSAQGSRVGIHLQGKFV